MKKLLPLILATTILISGCASNTTGTSETPAPDGGTTDAQTSSVSAAMITDTGGVNDQAFNQSAWEGLQKAESELGASIKFLESNQEADFGPNLDRLTDESHDIIWGVGFMMADAVHNAAKTNPDQLYGIVDFVYDDDSMLDNMVTVNFRAQEPSFLVGYMAAKTTKTDAVGFIGGIRGEIISQFEYGFRAGVAYASEEMGKDVEVIIQYAESFTDSAAGKAITTSMYSKGADIVFHAAGGVGIGVFEAAIENDKLAIGVDLDQAEFAPNHVMTSALKDVGEAMFNVVKDINDGIDVSGQNFIFGLEDGAVGIPDNESTRNLVDSKVYAETEALIDKIVDGTIVPPANEEEFEVYMDEL